MEIFLLMLGVTAIVLLLHLEFRITKNQKQSTTNHLLEEVKLENKMIREIILKQQTLQHESMSDLSASMKDSFYKIGMELLKSNAEGQKLIQETLTRSLINLQNANDRRLQDIQRSVNEKLDQSLNARLDSSFRQIGDQLSTLYKSLGELQSLSSGVSDLQKTLSNVKTRGIFGEFHLKNILMDIMDASQYEENIATKRKSSDRVEFADRKSTRLNSSHA